MLSDRYFTWRVSLSASGSDRTLWKLAGGCNEEGKEGKKKMLSGHLGANWAGWVFGDNSGTNSGLDPCGAVWRPRSWFYTFSYSRMLYSTYDFNTSFPWAYFYGVEFIKDHTWMSPTALPGGRTSFALPPANLYKSQSAKCAAARTTIEPLSVFFFFLNFREGFASTRLWTAQEAQDVMWAGRCDCIPARVE